MIHNHAPPARISKMMTKHPARPRADGGGERGVGVCMWSEANVNVSHFYLRAHDITFISRRNLRQNFNHTIAGSKQPLNAQFSHRAWGQISDTFRKHASAGSQNLGFVIGDEDDMLVVGAGLAVQGDHRPLVFENARLGGSQVDHGLDGESHAGLETRTFALFAVVRHLGLFVELSADTMTDEFAHDGVAVLRDVIFDAVAEIAEHPTISGIFDSVEQ